MSDSETVDRVAQAISGKLLPTEDNLEAVARMAIEAMRKPTDAMVKSAQNHIGGYGYGDECSSGDAVEVWSAMIDEALR